ncbi:hypothetical protein MJO28_010523 [Puccinia striiformis f. sp. tritici]|uniref:Uncharacterized protein n=4 Tax=Puccinia striiformis TaxID=27350 RepID=A0A0L0V2X4_9BASI|nr:hypothetical protein Pst134EA_019327 [Puccinia striiformis f. sp. tritici]KAI9613981.1 hypothetical protein H4Q26_009835 [Puccinia striiformis f. sp. tritici PST-130]KNE93660.1 hypothetical protein PSTG_12943 [Puccinia striiformis f. sp. tritici PST-78]POW16439.1 hypothetical protein PSTT_01278 [Puccinia striiformis]KAH9449403.1 hypothetical protein Pst134EB_020226 [Puccinia striiformis f. sp. tritici]KAH9459174.1 hypothetical protein Pst134EA_019327 [Puccinia striiformis f. sp. tritici]
MKFFQPHGISLWILAIVASSTFFLASSTSLNNHMKAFQVKQSILTKRHLTGPRIVFVPLAGPVSFDDIFNAGVPSGSQDHNDKPEPLSRFKVAATQALSDVVQRYAKDHPEKSEKVSLDMREVWLVESGQIDPQADEDKVLQARNDLAAFFKEHPDLQKQAQDDFKDRVNQLFHSPKTIDWDGEDEILNDWAHINPTDD